MKRLLYTIFTVLLLSGLAAVFLALGITAGRQRRDRHCTGIEIAVRDSDGCSLLRAEELEAEVSRNCGDCLGKRIDSLPLQKIEALLSRKGAVRGCEAYATPDGILHLVVTQRRPEVSIAVADAVFHIDEEGYVFQGRPGQAETRQTATGQTETGQTGTRQTGTGRTKTGQTAIGQTGPRQPATGQTKTGQTGTGQTGTGQTEPGQTGTEPRLRYTGPCHSHSDGIPADPAHRQWLRELFGMMRFLRADRSLREAFPEIRIDRKGRLSLISRIGGETTILFGPPEEYERKFKKIKDYYQYVYPRASGRKYKEVNVQYRGQLVCR